MLLLAIAVMADGFFGPRVTPLNLAGVLPWIHWRALSVIALLVIGNVFCMACPFTLVRDIGRTVLPAKWRWPRGLRTKWLAAGLLVVYLWAYEAFSLWDSPWMTAWIIAGYFGAALLVDGFFRGATFLQICLPDRPVSFRNFATFAARGASAERGRVQVLPDAMTAFAGMSVREDVNSICSNRRRRAILIAPFAWIA